MSAGLLPSCRCQVWCPVLQRAERGGGCCGRVEPVLLPAPTVCPSLGKDFLYFTEIIKLNVRKTKACPGCWVLTE